MDAAGMRWVVASIPVRFRCYRMQTAEDKVRSARSEVEIMPTAAHDITHAPRQVVEQHPASNAANGVRYAMMGETALATHDLERMVSAVPVSMAAAIAKKTYYFVPLTVSEGDETLIADRYDVKLSDNAVCHRNYSLGDAQCVFISTRLMDDKFSVAFEFYINVGHAFVENAGISGEFSEVVWRQVESGVRGETSLDAHEYRGKAVTRNSKEKTFAVADERAKSDYLRAAFSDAIAIYLLSLYIDVDYYDLREREYPLLTPAAMAERLRKIADLFPPNPSFEFNVFYRRRV